MGRSMGKGRQSERRNNTSDGRRRDDFRNGQNDIGVVAALDRIANNQDAAGLQSGRRELGKRYRELATIIGIYAAAIVALGAILITHRDAAQQVSTLEEQIREMRAEERPWVGLSGIGPHQVSPRPQVGTNFFIFVNWMNGGKTPAFHATASFTMQMLPASTMPKIPPDICESCGEGDVMLPNIPIARTPHIEGSFLTEHAKEEIIAKRTFIWLTGRIDYADGGGAPHKTFACYRFEWDGSFITCPIPGSNYAD